MTRGQFKELLNRVLTWPPERQADFEHVVKLMEDHDNSDLGLRDERAAGCGRAGAPCSLMLMRDLA